MWAGDRGSVLPRAAWVGLRLTTGRLFWIAFAVGAGALLLLYGSGFAVTGEAPVILMAMSVPGVVLTFHLVVSLAIDGAEWLALPLVAGVNGLVYGGVAVALWKTYRLLTRKRDTAP